MSPRPIVRVMMLTAAAGLLLTPAFSQGRGGGGGGTAPPTTGGGTTGGAGAGAGAGSIPTTPTTTTRTPTSNPTNQTQQQPASQQPIFVSGRVLLEDGTPPLDSVVLETVCGASPRAEGYTDSKGFFSLELGRRSGVLQDASESSGFGGFGGADNDPFGSMNAAGNSSIRPIGGPGPDMRYMNCELRARLAGYRSQSVSLANRRPLDNPDVGIILLHRFSQTEDSTVSAISLKAPKDARKAYEKGLDELKKKKVDNAMKEFQKAVKIYPEYASAWHQLGRIQMAKGDKEAARKSLDVAIAADDKFVPPYVEVAVLELQAQKWQELADITDKAAKLDAFDYPQLFFFNAVANFNLRKLDLAEESVRRAERLDTRHQIPKVSHLFGLLLAQRQDYQGAAEQFRNYLKFAPNAADADTVRSQLDQVEKFSAQTKQDRQP